MGKRLRAKDDIHRSRWHVNHQRNFLPCSLRGDVIGFMIEGDTAIRTNQAGKDPMMIAPKPAVRWHRTRQWRQFWKCRKRLAWWLITTGAALMRALMVRMVLEWFCGTLHLLSTLRMMNSEIFFLLTTMISFNTSMLLGLMGRTQARLHLDAVQKTQQR